jgi:transcriptional regulator with XRE-family HTH domain
MYNGAVMHLSDYMTEQNLTDAAVAEAIGRSRATVNRIRNRKVRPDWETIKAIRQFTRGKVTADDFEEVGTA